MPHDGPEDDEPELTPVNDTPDPDAEQIEEEGEPGGSNFA
jgi:hypothetical protein